MNDACRSVMVLVALALLAVPPFVVAEFDPGEASFDDLIFRAQRYGDTVQKRAEKRKAIDELHARGADSLRQMMSMIHVENVMLAVLTQELVEALPGDEAVPVLLEFLDSQQEKTVRMAAFFLGFKRAPEFAAQVEPLLNNHEASGAAIRTLGKWQVTNAVPLIAPFLQDTNEIRRIQAANALRDIGDASAIPMLEPLLEDEFFTVRKVAERAIDSLKASTANGRPR